MKVAPPKSSVNRQQVLLLQNVWTSDRRFHSASPALNLSFNFKTTFGQNIDQLGGATLHVLPPTTPTRIEDPL